jgi:hypothetical protein
VCLVKDNPNPATFDLVATGSRPQVEVEEATIEFDRLLLNQTAKKTLRFTNTSRIPVKWALSDLTALPAQFSVSKGEG